MRVAELYASTDRPVVSLEFFPPRDPSAEEGFYRAVDTLSGLHPDYTTVTFGAGGSTRDGSYQTVRTLLTEKNLPTVAYIAGYGLGPDEITAVLDRYRDLGVKTIFVIRGDKPRGSDFTPHPDSFSYASDLIAFIRERYDFDLGCAGYPEGNNSGDGPDRDIAFLKQKVDNGAQYVVSQYCYDTEKFFTFVEKCRATGISVPIIPGIMPVYSVKMTRNLCTLCGASLPPAMQKHLQELADREPKEAAAYGVAVAIAQCRELLKHGVDGLHFYTMDRAKSLVEIISALRGDNLL